jgi:glucose/arabinose dehydrogenase
MKNHLVLLTCLMLTLFTVCCNNSEDKKEANAGDTSMIKTSSQQKLLLPAPYATESATKFSKVIGWKEGEVPVAPEGFHVSRFANQLDNPRWIYQAPNGDVFVAESNTETDGFKKVKAVVSGKSKSQNTGGSANRITLFRDADKDGRYEIRQTYLTGLNRPLGMLVLNNSFYVANTDGLLQYPYKPEETKLSSQPKKILQLPAGGYNNHWTRNIIANADGSKIYISVGSGSNVAEHGMENEVRRAAILEINPDGSGERIYASGLRNPVGMDWADGVLWTAVNERDGLGDDLVPDYITSVKENGFYGWPYSYFGQHEDPRMKGQGKALVEKAIVPDVPVGAHTASLGLAFYDKQAFPAKYRNGAFVAQHGSWNRSAIVGYKVLFVPFSNGKPSGNPEDFLTGFIADEEKAEVHGRPVGLAVLEDGSLLLADDAGNTIWQVSAVKK